MKRKERFKNNGSSLQSNYKMPKYFVCCCPEKDCNGDLMLMIDSDGLLTTNQKKGIDKMFRVHSKQADSISCTQNYYCK